MEKIKELLNARKAFSARILGVLLLFLGLALPNVVKADTASWTSSSGGYTTKQGNITLSGGTQGGSGTNRYYQISKNNTFAITADDGYLITNITLTTSSTYSGSGWSKTYYPVSGLSGSGYSTTGSNANCTGTWSGNSQTVSLTASSTTRIANVTVTYQKTYSITSATVTGGSIKANVNNTEVTSAAENATVTLSNSPATGYEFVAGSYSVVRNSGGAVTVTNNQFTMPAEGVTVSGQFVRVYDVNISNPTGGSITATPSPAQAGATVTLTVATIAGYEFKSLTVANGTQTVATTKVDDTHYTFTMPNHAVTVSGTFEPIPVENGNVVYLSQIDESKVYTLASQRAFLYYSSSCDYLLSSTATGYTAQTENAEDANQQFKFVSTGTAGQYYLYSVGAQQYVSSNGYQGTFTDSKANALVLTVTASSAASGEYKWYLQLGNYGMNSQSSGQYTYGIIVNNWTTHDAGNTYRIVEASYKPEPEETTVFVRKTSGAIDPNKKYLIVYEKSDTEAILMKSKFTSATESPYARAILGVSGFTINNNAIETSDKNAIVFVASSTEGRYYLKNNGAATDYYCGTTSAQQYLNVSTSPMNHTVEFDATDGHAIIKSTYNEYELKFSPTAGAGAYTGFTGLDGFYYNALHNVYLYEEVSADGYRVTCSSNTGGTVTANPYYGLAGGETVTLTVTAQTGYELVSLTAKDATGATVAIENNSFTMPEHDVTVSAVFAGRDDIYVLKGSGDIDTSKRYVLVCQDGLNPATGIMMKSDFTAYSTGDNNRGVAGEEIIITNNYLTTDAANTFSFEDAGDGKFYVKNHVGYYMGAFTTESDTQDQYFNVTQTASENYYNAVSFGPYGNVLLTSVSEMPLQYDANIRNNTDLFFYGGWNTDGTFRGLVYLYEQLSDYKITCETEEGGLVAANPAFAPAGTEISLSTFPEAGHSFLSLAVKDINGNPITVTGNKFTMPPYDVIITSEWTRLPLTVSKYGWSTFYLNHPFVMPEGVTGVVISSYGQPEDIDFSLNLNYMYPAGSVVPTKTPILVKGNQGSYTYSLSEVEGTAPDTNWLRGQMRYGMIVPEESAVDTHYYYKLTTGTSEGNKGVLGFFWGADGGDEFYLKGDNRAYLVVPRTASASAMRFNFDEEVPDGILDLKPETSNMEHGTIYNLAGQRISQPVRGQIYIMNGQKFIAK